MLGLLFEDGPVIELSPSMEERNVAQNGRYIFHIHEELAKQFRGKYFTRHSGIIALGILATFAVGPADGGSCVDSPGCMGHGVSSPAGFFFAG